MTLEHSLTIHTTLCKHVSHPSFLSAYSAELLCFRKKIFTPVIAFSSTDEQPKVMAIWPEKLATFCPLN